MARKPSTRTLRACVGIPLDEPARVNLVSCPALPWAIATGGGSAGTAGSARDTMKPIETPRVSVFMNARNGAAPLEAALESIMHHTFADWS